MCLVVHLMNCPTLTTSNFSVYDFVCVLLIQSSLHNSKMVAVTITKRRRNSPLAYVLLLVVAVVLGASVETTFESQDNLQVSQQQASQQQESQESQQQPTHGCSSYEGILLIALAPKLAAAGTVFFQSVINQLLYAELHNLKPWVHLSPILKWVFDEQQFAGSVTLPAMEGMTISTNNDSYAGPPIIAPGASALHQKVYQLDGTGIWNHYFEQVSDRGDCPHLPLLQFTWEHIKPGFHAHCPWAVRSWRYLDLPLPISQPSLSYKDWYWPMRQRASDIVKRYFRFQDSIRDAAEGVSPPDNEYCLAMHVRHSDKSAGRRVVHLEEFYPYLQAYQRAGGKHIFVATDSAAVLEQMQNATSLTIYSQQDIIRSKTKTAVFKQASHHRTNVEVLVDILALSKCQFFLHGRSAVSEAVFYLNLELHGQSVDLEDKNKYSVKQFEQVVKTKLSGK